MFISNTVKELKFEVINMHIEEIWNEIENIFGTPGIGIMSTAHDNVPNSRYMMFYNDGKNLYTKTKADSVKVEEIDDNNLAYIVFGYDEETDSSYLEILAEVEIVRNQVTIDWLWEQEEDHNLDLEEEYVSVVLKFVPRHIKLMNANDEIDKPEVIDFTSQ